MVKKIVLLFFYFFCSLLLLFVGYKIYKRFSKKKIKKENTEEITTRIRIRDFDDVYEMIGEVTKHIKRDSLDFVKTFDTIALEKGLQNAEDLKYYFFADTHDFYKIVSPRGFFNFFERQHKDFWTEERISKQKKLGLTQEQVYILASIVEKETGGKPDEQRRIAGLYLNRYRKDMKLQSCPTVIYALKKEKNSKKEVKRLYWKDLKISSPYNTYLNKGFPKGPICVVTKTSIDNVLDAEENNYLYMSSDPNRPGYNRFTNSGKEHFKNAKEYHRWLNFRKIK